MADLTMSLGYEQQNDNKAIILTDTSNYNSTFTPNLTSGDNPVVNAVYEIVTQGTVDFTTVGSTSNAVGSRFIYSGIVAPLGAGDELKTVTPKVTAITAATLDTTITGVDNVPTVKSQVNLFTEFSGPWTDQSQLVYTITAALLGDTADTELIDGLYALEYNVTHQPAQSTTSKTEKLEVVILVYGQVKVAVYDKYRQIPAWCNCKDQDALHFILETDLCGAYLTAIETSAYIAKTEELINMLIVLDDMVKNGSKLYY